MSFLQNKIVLNILKILVTVCIVWFLLHKIDLKQIMLVIGRCRYSFLFLASGAFVLSKIISSVRLNYFLKAVDITVSERFNLKLYWLGMYYNLFLPGGIGGDGYKIYFLQKKFNVGTGKVFSAIFLDRVTGMFALFALLVVAGYFMPIPVVYKYTIWGILPLSTAVFYLVLKWKFGAFTKVFRNTNLMSLGVQVAQLLSAFFILLALGHTDNMAGYLFVFLVSSVVAVIPFTIGGVGSRELTFFLCTQWLSLDLNLSVALSLLFFLITALVSLWGVVYCFKTLQMDNTI
jgi:glycosyltransferase 2 family protein